MQQISISEMSAYV